MVLMGFMTFEEFINRDIGLGSGTDKLNGSVYDAI